jgi:hypothetical protein
MRSNLNLSEQLPAYLVLLLLSGIYYPTIAAPIGFFYSVSAVCVQLITIATKYLLYL